MSNVSVAAWDPNRLDIFGVGQDTACWHNWANLGQECVRMHIKTLTAPTVNLQTMIDSMEQVYLTANIGVEIVSEETLNINDPAISPLNDVDCGSCMMGTVTNEQTQLFNHRNNVGANEVVVYFVRSTVPAYNGCAAHPAGRPGAVVARGATQWTLAHEVGHVLGLSHVNNSDRLMTGGGTANITNPPPDIIASEAQTMLNSNLTGNC